MQNRLKIKFSILAYFFLVIVIVFLLPNFVFADVDVWGGGNDEVSEESLRATTGLGTDDPRIIVAKVIRIALGFLGIIVVILIMYAGWLYMSSEGDETKTAKALAIIKNAIIGLLIILSAFAITSFIISRLLSSANGELSKKGKGQISYDYLGALGSGILEGHYPESNAKNIPRNTKIAITFRESIDPVTVCQEPKRYRNDDEECQETDNDYEDCVKKCLGEFVVFENIRIFKKDLGDKCESLNECGESNNNSENIKVYSTNNNKIFVFRQDIGNSDYFGSSSSETDYSVKLMNGTNIAIENADGDTIQTQVGLKKLDGDNVVFSKEGYYSWSFEISTEIDLIPPTVKFIFPKADNEQDEYSDALDAKASTGKIIINNSPNIYEKMKVIIGNDNGVNPDEIDASISEYAGLVNGEVRITPSANITLGETSGQGFVYTSLDNICGSGSGFYEQNSKKIELGSCGVIIEPIGDDYPKYTEGDQIGQYKQIIIKVFTKIKSDILQVGDKTYYFVNGNKNDPEMSQYVAIDLLGLSFKNAIATKIKFSINSSVVNAEVSNNEISLIAKTVGASGNEIVLISSNLEAIIIIEMSGGEDADEISQNVKGEKDQPKNVIIQMVFSESIDPITASGKIIGSEENNGLGNCLDALKTAVTNSTENTPAYNIVIKDLEQCLAGEYQISNLYRTVEFRSNSFCGVNTCGKDIYCLPAKKNIKTLLMTSNVDSDGFAVYPLKGIVDMADNPLDGNSDGISDGNLNTYNVNTPLIDNGDNYAWSFWTSNEIKATAPKIIEVYPQIDQGNNENQISNLSRSIEISFGEMIYSSTLRPGKLYLDDDEIETEYLILKNESSSPISYWVVNKSIFGDDGFYYTKAFIKHFPDFLVNSNYGFIVGSGIMDMYQNCFNPCSGPENCDGNPSCCNGAPNVNKVCD